MASTPFTHTRFAAAFNIVQPLNSPTPSLFPLGHTNVGVGAKKRPYEEDIDVEDGFRFKKQRTSPIDLNVPAGLPVIHIRAGYATRRLSFVGSHLEITLPIISLERNFLKAPACATFGIAGRSITESTLITDSNRLQPSVPPASLPSALKTPLIKVATVYTRSGRIPTQRSTSLAQTTPVVPLP